VKAVTHEQRRQLPSGAPSRTGFSDALDARDLGRNVGVRAPSRAAREELGREHARVARLREVKHVLELEVASHKTPERVDFVARTLLGMSEPTPDRILPAGKRPTPEAAQAQARAEEVDRP
jgi:hypothetical protein